MAQRAIQADPDDPWPHFAAGYVHMVSRGFEQAVAELTEAIDLNPSFAFAHMILGCAYGYGGMPADGLHHFALASRLSPRDFTRSANFSTCGLCSLRRGAIRRGCGLGAARGGAASRFRHGLANLCRRRRHGRATGRSRPRAVGGQAAAAGIVRRVGRDAFIRSSRRPTGRSTFRGCARRASNSSGACRFGSAIAAHLAREHAGVALPMSTASRTAPSDRP